MNYCTKCGKQWHHYNFTNGLWLEKCPECRGELKVSNVALSRGKWIDTEGAMVHWEIIEQELDTGIRTCKFVGTQTRCRQLMKNLKVFLRNRDLELQTMFDQSYKLWIQPVGASAVELDASWR